MTLFLVAQEQRRQLLIQQQEQRLLMYEEQRRREVVGQQQQQAAASPASSTYSSGLRAMLSDDPQEGSSRQTGLYQSLPLQLESLTNQKTALFFYLACRAFNRIS